MYLRNGKSYTYQYIPLFRHVAMHLELVGHWTTWLLRWNVTVYIDNHSTHSTYSAAECGIVYTLILVVTSSYSVRSWPWTCYVYRSSILPLNFRPLY